MLMSPQFFWSMWTNFCSALYVLYTGHRLITDRLHTGHWQITDRSHMSHIWVIDALHMGYRCVIYESQRVHRWITNELHSSYRCVTWGLHMGHTWVTCESDIGHRCVSLLRTTFTQFLFEINHLWPHHNRATLQIWKKNLIFQKSEEGNPVVSLVIHLWRVTSWFFAHRGDTRVTATVEKDE